MNVPGILLLGFALLSCDDRMSHSLTPSDTTASFTVETSMEEADRILGLLAERAGKKFVRHPSPQTNAIPRDYISTVQTGSCMIFAEGDASGAAIQLVVSLQVVRGKMCEPEIVQAFKEAELMFRH
jgi:hypothetical protein